MSADVQLPVSVSCFAFKATQRSLPPGDVQLHNVASQDCFLWLVQLLPAMDDLQPELCSAEKDQTVRADD